MAELGLAGRFDATTSELSLGDDSFSLQTVAYGRQYEMVTFAPAVAALCGCYAGAEDPEGNCIQALERAYAGLVEWWVRVATALSKAGGLGAVLRARVRWLSKFRSKAQIFRQPAQKCVLAAIRVATDWCPV